MRVKKERTAKHIQSDINRIKANIEQLENGDVFSKRECKELIPIYKNQLERLKDELKTYC